MNKYEFYIKWKATLVGYDDIVIQAETEEEARIILKDTFQADYRDSDSESFVWEIDKVEEIESRTTAEILHAISLYKRGLNNE